ncbi:MAG: AIM24 family protein, partial [Bacteroidales bacterium]|nr:AIM24 family protein [Bacteroidales bacterium]
VGEEDSVAVDAQNLVSWDGGLVVEVVIVAGSGDGCEVRFVREAVVVAVEAGGQLHKTAVGEEDSVAVDAQNLVSWDGGLVVEVVIVAGSGDGCEVRFVCEAVVVAVEKIRLVRKAVVIAVEADGQLHETAIGEEDGVAVDA